ncbi:hypothetical protein EN850_13295 [Mesorhizobium sp. M8A.F.Ca.ET.207.01.1.1]|uniref:HNH endonuclease n=1 Tax=Mesorhizobium sp. M8A.F.Ca.ET.207.01.1.1 TaxID=2563968 RepID=UPI00109D278E|nr:hypothetical protein [Mesorhizobium sp. M8A.F.Ca.ET.207.01.1.1]TGQ80252.1 hypothetical protein EN850_13295 [Mesorhizobium sp. M8A.F.Ca.ET.207.01.1.1]
MTPVKYSATSQLIVDKFEASAPDKQVGSYWSEDEVSPVRKEIKDHYIQEQNQRCCYCLVEIPTGNNAVWDGEHIISRDGAPRFMFEPVNLCISCKDCNGSKRELEVRKNPARKSFPSKSEHYKIVHPHLDPYAEHIRWFGKVVSPLSKKGVETVAMCDLTRFGRASAGASKVPTHPAMDKQIGVLMDPQADLIEMRMALASLTEYFKLVPQH